MFRPKPGSVAFLAISIISIGCQNTGQIGAAGGAGSGSGVPASVTENAGDMNASRSLSGRPRPVDGVTRSTPGVGDAANASANPVTMADAPVLGRVGDTTGEMAPLTKDDVILLTARGASDEAIIDRIERGNAVFHLTAADENQLRDARVSDEVIRAMNDTGRRSF